MKPHQRFTHRNLSPKDRKTREISHLISKFNFWFEVAITPRIGELNDNIEKLTNKVRKIENEIEEFQRSNEENEENESHYEKYFDIYAELGEKQAEIDLLVMQKLSIEEMKIVCLYKEFEILLKEILAISFQDFDIDKIYKWEQIKTVLNNAGIIIGDIKNHIQINELRVINNNIKHQNIISDQVIKSDIVEFKDKYEFDSESLSKFYSRIKAEPIVFLKYIARKIIDYLFVFNDERIEKIASQYDNRINKETAVKLAKLLIKRHS